MILNCPTLSRRILFIGLLLTLGGVLLLENGCTYYNTFFNMKKHFEAGERANRNRGDQAPNTQGYKKCIETGARLLEFYPKSRWVDDCLLLMGKAYYRSGEYTRAQRKFEELISNFPRSKHIPEARLWLAETFVQLKRGPEALVVLEQLLASVQVKVFLARGAFLLGDIHFGEERYGDAADAYREAAQRYRDKVHRAESLYMLGRCLFMRKEFEEAKATFERIPKLKPPHDLVYMALVESGRCTAELGDIEGAKTLLDDLQKDIRFQDYSSGIDLTLANIASDQGDYDKAIRLYLDYLQSGQESAEIAEAFFHLGVIYRDHRRHLPTAVAYFDSAVTAGSGGLVDSARVEVEKLNRAITQLREMKDFEVWIQYADSVVRASSPIEEESMFESMPLPSDSSAPEIDSVLEQAAAVEESLLVETPPPLDSTKMPSDSSALKIDSVVEQTAAAKESLLVETPPTQLDSTKPQIDSVLGQTHAIEESLLTEIPPKLPDSLLQKGEGLPDTSASEQDTLSQVPPAGEEQLTMQDIISAKTDLQILLFQIGEFYRYHLQEADSAAYFFERAAQDTYDPMTQWRANLALAQLAKERGEDEQVIRQYHETALAIDGVSLEAENWVRETLGLPLKSPPRDTLWDKYLAIEEGIFDTTATPDSLLVALDSILTADPLLAYYPKLLFAKAYIYEHRLENLDLTKAVYRHIISLYPDSVFSWVLVGQLDSTILSAGSETGLLPGSPEGEAEGAEVTGEGGWPPPEESLLGRRGR